MFVKHGSDPEIAAFIDACACVVATEVVIFDPSLVVVGGGVTEMQGFPFERLKKEIHAKLKKPYPADYVHVERPRVKEHAGIKGAAYFALGLQDKHKIR